MSSLLPVETSGHAPGIRQATTGAGVAATPTPTPDPTPNTPPNAKFIPPESNAWTVVDYTDKGWPIVGDALIVKFKSGVSEIGKESILAEFGAETEEVFEPGGARMIRVAAEQRERIRRELASNPNVEYAEPDAITMLAQAPRLEPNDPQFASEWHLDKIQAAEGWSITQGSPSTVIAIIDTGVDYNHPDLIDKVIKGPDYDQGDYDPMDEHGHGTQVAGLAAAATNNGVGIAAVGWQPMILAIRSPGREDILWRAMYDAYYEGARVISLSMVLGEHFQFIYEAVEDLTSKGVVIVAGVGNGDGNCDMLYPAAYPEVIAVSGSDVYDRFIVGCSNAVYPEDYTGPRRSGPDIAAPGAYVLSTTLGGGYGAGVGSAGIGTSFATPIVAGTAALMLGCNPDGATVRHALLSTADDIEGEGWDNLTGWGRVNVYRALSAACSSSPAITISASPNPATGAPVTVEVTATDIESDLAVLSFLDEGNHWTPAIPGESQNCSTGSCSIEYTIPSFPHANWTYRLTAVARDTAGHVSAYCAYGCPDNDVCLGVNNYYELKVGTGQGSEPLAGSAQCAPPFLHQPTTSPNSVSLSWTDTGESVFYLQQSIDGGPLSDVTPQLAADTTSYTDALDPSEQGRQLTYRVRAAFADGSVSVSNPRSIDAPEPPPPPSPSLNVSVYCTGNEHVGVFTPWASLSWTAKSGYTGQYRVQYRESGGSWQVPSIPWGVTGGTSLSIGLENNTSYDFRVLLEQDQSLWAGPVSRSVDCSDPQPPAPGGGNLQVSSYCDNTLGYEHRVVAALDWAEYEWPGDPVYCVEARYPDSIYSTVGCTESLHLTTTFVSDPYWRNNLRDNTEIAWKVYVNGDTLWSGPIYDVTDTCKSDVTAETLNVRAVDGNSRIEPGEAVEALVWLKNNSSKPASIHVFDIHHNPPHYYLPFEIDLWGDRVTPIPQVGDTDYTVQTETTLAAYEERQFTMAFTAPDTVGSKTAWVIGDGSGALTELDEGNNEIPFDYTVSALSPPCDYFGDVNDDGYVTHSDVQMVTDHVQGTVILTDPEQIRRADVNADGQVSATDVTSVTQYKEETVPTLSVCQDIDDDGLPNYQDQDDDGDGFSEAVEVWISTDTLDACPDDSNDAAWPLDINNNGVITTTGDVVAYSGRIGATPGSPNWWQRLDLDANGMITVAGDVIKYSGKVGATCT
jgi:thermitase